MNTFLICRNYKNEHEMNIYGKLLNLFGLLICNRHILHKHNDLHQDHRIPILSSMGFLMIHHIPMVNHHLMQILLLHIFGQILLFLQSLSKLLHKNERNLINGIAKNKKITLNLDINEVFEHVPEISSRL